MDLLPPAASPSTPLIIHVVDQKAFVWDAETVRILRSDYHIVGALVGSLPRLPLQNTFFGLPLALIPEEVALLLAEGIAIVVDGTTAHSPTSSSGTNSNQSQSPQQSIPLASVSPTSSNLWNFPTTPHDHRRYHVFRALWSQGYYITVGTKFGGDFLVYPGDPLRFHSHQVVSVMAFDQPVTPMDLVAVGRLGSTVNKTHLLCSWQEVQEGQGSGDADEGVDVFAVEWAGF